MSSYVISGVARGIGYEFLSQLSADPNNTVFGLVRDKAVADKKITTNFPDRKNIHIIQADVTDYEAVKNAADYVSTTTGGSIDYIIANAGIVSLKAALAGFGELSQDHQWLEQDISTTFRTNVIGPINLFNLFVPLLLEGKTKKAIAISSGMADSDMVTTHDIYHSGPYAISKAALNMAVAKFSAEYRKQGALFMSICPGWVKTEMGNDSAQTELEKQSFVELFTKFQEYEPSFQGPITPEESVKAVLSVLYNSSVEGGQAGAYLSHHGNKRWL
ncbi:hypothetical protein SCUP234_07994 [Seiridium cupressi]